MDNRRLIEAYRKWFSQYSWNWFGTLTFRGYPPFGKAHRCFDSWINELKLRHGRPDFRWVRVAERGADGYNLHFHVLVGGMRLSSGSRYLAMNRWQQLAGEADIHSFVPRKGGISYSVKTATPHKDFEIDFHLQPIKEKRS